MYNFRSFLLSLTAALSLLSGCATTYPLSPTEVCLYSPDWQLIEAPPPEVSELITDVSKRPGLADLPPNSSTYWFRRDSGSLRMCRQKPMAQNVCGSVTVEFNLVRGQWMAESGALVPVCED